MATDENKAAAADDLDAIPIQKTSPIVYVVAGVAVLLVGGLAIYGLAGSGKGKQQQARDIAAQVDSAAAQKPPMSEKELREFQAMNARAMANLDEKKKQEEAAAAAKKEAEAAEAEAAPKPGAGAAPKGPSPKAADLDKIGDDILKGL